MTDNGYWAFLVNHTSHAHTIEYELWLILNTHITLYVRLRLHGALGCSPGSFRSCLCWLLLPSPLPSDRGGIRTTFAVILLSVPASTPTQCVGLDSEKVVSTLKRSLDSFLIFSTARRDFSSARSIHTERLPSVCPLTCHDPLEFISVWMCSVTWDIRNVGLDNLCSTLYCLQCFNPL